MSKQWATLAPAATTEDAPKGRVRPKADITDFPTGPKCTRASAPSASGPPRVAIQWLEQRIVLVVALAVGDASARQVVQLVLIRAVQQGQGLVVLGG